jgi:predicted small metal-binding protein
LCPGARFTADAPTEDELLQKVAAHAREAHGVTEVTPELLSKVKSAIVTQK